MVFLQPEAAERMLTSFYETGTADDSLFVPNVVDFEVGFGFPAMAKVGVGTVGVVVAGAIGVTVWLLVR